jgi:hypothetical protein
MNNEKSRHNPMVSGRIRFSGLVALLLWGLIASAAAQTNVPDKQTPYSNDPICLLIQSAARANALPIDFFARLIWQESRFRPDEIGPITRTGQRAQGIAQFMPGTAEERRLYEPFNPVEALPKSGEFLAELRDQFGNLGLAAAAYNAGPQRVREFISGQRDLPQETRNYVRMITGHPIEEWLVPSKNSDKNYDSKSSSEEGTLGCPEMMASLHLSSNPGLTESQLRNFPAWCRYLHNPNGNICGPVHQQVRALVLSSSGAAKWHSSISLRHRPLASQPTHLSVLR